MKYAIGIDIGGTNTRVALIDEIGAVSQRTQFPTNVQNPLETMNEIVSCITKMEVDLVGIGVSCPGPLDLVNQKVLNPPNLPGWENFELSKELSKLTNLPVTLENDANLAAFAESTIGGGKGHSHVQFLTISTGVGSGLVIDGKIQIGAHGFAHEIANMILWNQGPQMNALQPGAIEGICSGTAITFRAQQAGLVVSHAGEVNDLAKQGNEIAASIMEDVYTYLSNGIATIFAIIDPSIIILGGSVALKIDGFCEEIERRVKAKVYPNLAQYVRIVKSEMGEDAGLIGAGHLAMSKN